MNSKMIAEEAYIYVDKQRNRHGKYAVQHPTIPNFNVQGTPEMTGPMEQTIEFMGGWNRFCDSDQDPVEERKEFCEVYNKFLCQSVGN